MCCVRGKHSRQGTLCKTLYSLSLVLLIQPLVPFSPLALLRHMALITYSQDPLGSRVSLVTYTNVHDDLIWVLFHFCI